MPWHSSCLLQERGRKSGCIMHKNSATPTPSGRPTSAAVRRLQLRQGPARMQSPKLCLLATLPPQVSTQAANLLGLRHVGGPARQLGRSPKTSHRPGGGSTDGKSGTCALGLRATRVFSQARWSLGDGWRWAVAWEVGGAEKWLPWMWMLAGWLWVLCLVSWCDVSGVLRGVGVAGGSSAGSAGGVGGEVRSGSGSVLIDTPKRAA